jgi:hypothetical protein
LDHLSARAGRRHEPLDLVGGERAPLVADVGFGVEDVEAGDRVDG